MIHINCRNTIFFRANLLIFQYERNLLADYETNVKGGGDRGHFPFDNIEQYKKSVRNIMKCIIHI